MPWIYISNIAVCALSLTGLFVWFYFRRKLERQQFIHEASECVVQNQLAARQLEIDNLNYRIQEIQARSEQRENNLEETAAVAAEHKLRAAELHVQTTQLQSQIDELIRSNREQLDDITRYREEIARRKAISQQQQRQNEEKLALLDNARAQLSNEFKSVASDIFEAKQRSFKEQSQAQLDGMLKPLGEKIRDFEKRVEENYSQESRERFSLIKEVKTLQDLNARISQDAINLTNALKGDNKTQGTWGEVILERVLEKSGLVKGREYEIQMALKNESGRRRQPDVVVHLPDNKDLIIDSKVSLTSYERYCSAEDPRLRTEALGQHIHSIRQHIKQLSGKDYQNLTGIRTLDFVLLFVPVEAAFAVAVQHDGELFANAFDKNIVLVAPSTLLATLRTIQNIWRYEQQNTNAQEIASKAGGLYDKFVNFVADLEDIGSRLGSVQLAYDKAHNKLTSGKGNLVGRAEAIKELGAKVSKSMPQNLVEMPKRSNRQLTESAQST